MGRDFGKFVSFAFTITFLTLIVYGVLKWMDIPRGHFMDWMIAIVSFWWLLIVVTFPWNLYFKAKNIVQEGLVSKEKGIKINEEDIVYARKVYKKAITVAILLHFLSAGGLFLVAYYQISAIGYIGAVFAIVSMGFRPAVVAHQYISERLSGISQEFRYPREDIYTLKSKITNIENSIEYLKAQLNTEDKESLVSRQNKSIEYVKSRVNEYEKQLEMLKVDNNVAHEKILKEHKEATVKLSEDSRFLEHISELIRFFKKA